MFEMKPEYLTGIEFIDQEHTELFRIANETYELYKNEFIHDKYDKIVAILDELKNYTNFHFAHEQQYMKSIGYKRLLSHIVEHKDFVEKLDSFDLQEVDMNQSNALVELLEFFNDWLVNHIFETDKKIAVE